MTISNTSLPRGEGENWDPLVLSFIRVQVRSLIFVAALEFSYFDLLVSLLNVFREFTFAYKNLEHVKISKEIILFFSYY